MTRVETICWQITKEEAKRVKEGKEVLIYNKLFDIFRIETASKRSIWNSKHCSEDLLFFILRKDDLEDE